ncbi:MAG TPA: HEPN domain-containing protein, partial [Polyangiaceae bacterium]
MTRDNAIENAQAELSKAQSARQAAKALAELALYDDAASRLYYAVFHLVSAALMAIGVQADTHSGVAPLLGQHLVKPGLLPAQVSRYFARLMSLRGQADYNRHFLMDAEGFEEELPKAEALFSLVEAFLLDRG